MYCKGAQLDPNHEDLKESPNNLRGSVVAAAVVGVVVAGFAASWDLLVTMADSVVAAAGVVEKFLVVEFGSFVFLEVSHLSCLYFEAYLPSANCLNLQRSHHECVFVALTKPNTS